MNNREQNPFVWFFYISLIPTFYFQAAPAIMLSLILGFLGIVCNPKSDNPKSASSMLFDNSGFFIIYGLLSISNLKEYGGAMVFTFMLMILTDI